MPFISFEGIDHCGKRTQVERIKSWLEAVTDKTVFCLSEPNDKTPIGQHIRRILKGEVGFPGDMELQRLFALCQAQDWECSIKPALSLGAFVILERYAHSTLAYSDASGLDIKTVHDMQKVIIGPTFQWPDVTVFIDISVKEATRRIETARSIPEYFEESERVRKAREAYHFISNSHHKFGNMVIVNGEQSVEVVTEEIKQLIMNEFYLT